MNIFAEILPLENFAFRKVKYYSVQFEDEEYPEFLRFLAKLEDETEYEEDMSNFFEWLEVVGDEEGAKDKFFRPEGYLSDTSALPPGAGIMKAYGLPVNDVRLYCLKLNEQVVILFNGGIKTSKKSQDCPNVKPFFIQANLLSKKINELIANKEIRWNDEYSDIIFDKELRIEL